MIVPSPTALRTVRELLEATVNPKSPDVHLERLAEVLLEQALPHLTDTGQPLAPLAAARRDYDAELTRMYQLGRRDAEEAANRRMIQVVETEARTLSESVIGPSDYEVWCDALRLGLDLAAHRNQPLVSDEQVLEAAGWFWHQLQDPPERDENSVTGAPEPDTFNIEGVITWSAEDGTRVDGEHRPPNRPE